ncbi:MAG: hypothetical protein JNM17_13080 [Archangium sp.]|nr:hypothetical protein [Archangium sp.]
MRPIFLVALLPLFAWGDIAPSRHGAAPSGACLGQLEGAACGAGGRCVKRTVSRPDFTSGVPPRWTNVDVLICVEPAKSFAPVAVAVLLALLVTAALRSRRTPSPR